MELYHEPMGTGNALRPLGFSLAAAFGLAFANDANLSVGGSPQLLKGHATVRMLREKIAMTVGAEATKVACDFWFKNEGRDCTLQVGFPDEGNANEDAEAGTKPTSNFTYFHSWVDGRKVPTKLVQGEDEVGWHVKTVRFAAGATVHVRDEYAASNGSGIAAAGNTQGACLWAEYTVHTGSSWKGTIGKSEIDVTFSRRFAPGRLRVVAAAKLSKHEDGRNLDHAPFPKRGTIVYRGVSKPGVHGRTLSFVRTNWRPTEEDDLNLWFDYSGIGK